MLCRARTLDQNGCFGLPAGLFRHGEIFAADVGESRLTIARTLLCACLQKPFYGLIFALIADKDRVRLYQPIPGFSRRRRQLQRRT